MSSTPEVRYTDAGKSALERAKDRYSDKLEHVVIERRYVPGDDIVEITAADVDNAQKQLVVLSTSRSRTRTIELLSILYFFTGLALAIGGIYFTALRRIINENPIQAFVILGGAVMMLLSGMMVVALQLQRRKLKEIPQTVERITEEKATSVNAAIKVFLAVGSGANARLYSPREFRNAFIQLTSFEIDRKSELEFAGREFSAELELYDIDLVRSGDAIRIIAEASDGDGLSILVFATFAKEEVNHLLKLRKGAPISVKGTIDRASEGSVSLRDGASVTPVGREADERTKGGGDI